MDLKRAMRLIYYGINAHVRILFYYYNIKRARVCVVQMQKFMRTLKKVSDDT